MRTPHRPAAPCAVIRPQIVGYIDGSLSREGRSQVGRHLNECAACDSVYMQARTVTRELSATLPGVGSEARPLGRMWQEIAAQIRRARRKPVSTPRLATGAVGLVLAIAFALAWSPGGVSSAPPTQPTAAIISGAVSDAAVTDSIVTEDSALTGDNDGTQIAMILSDPDATATPPPPLRSNYAPTPGATEAP